MNTDQAITRIRDAFARMDQLYGRVLFDEWALIAIADNRGHVLDYAGPRREDFAQSLARDLTPLRAELANAPHDAGTFGFSRDAAGSFFDAFIVAGASIYLLCNHTGGTIREISEDIRWRKAQAPFAELAEAFRLDPVAAPAL